VRATVASVLGLPAGSEAPWDRPLRELGLDSLMAVELRNALGQSINQSLQATLVFDYPTLDALTDYLLNDILKLSDRPSPDATPSLHSSATNVLADLTDDEAEELLLAELMKPKKKDSYV
jgi:acyl carrier protein